ncbi:MAG: FKBP-type peptidyl-prolyl cis-trans isomerase [Chromatiales bacterium]|nr:FKBP-type peptidyl-prolyl cis-trans isomerase [Chromatiales bacterium]
MSRPLPLILASFLLALPVVAPADGKAVSAGKEVALEFTMKLEDGTLVESNVGAPPFEYVHGEGQLMPGLEAALEGQAVDARISVRLAPEEAYGAVDPEAFQEVSAEQIPEQLREVGAFLTAQGFDGLIRVAEVREQTVLLDFNHPLAGQTLDVEMRVVGIR